MELKYEIGDKRFSLVVDLTDEEQEFIKTCKINGVSIDQVFQKLLKADTLGLENIVHGNWHFLANMALIMLELFQKQ